MATLITPQRFINLKAKVKAECQRRAYVGSVSAYGGTSYDFSATPAKGNKITAEYYTKNAVPMNAINSSKTPTTTAQGRKILDSEYTAMESNVAVYSTRNRYDRSGTDCSSSCTGLCYTTCSGSCTGCSGCTSCSGCSGSCTSCSGCSGSCTSCTGCSGCSGCTSCSGCSGGCTSCSGCWGGCTSCSGCWGCTSCSGCSGCTSCSGCSGCGGGCGGCSGVCSASAVT